MRRKSLLNFLPDKFSSLATLILRSVRKKALKLLGHLFSKASLQVDLHEVKEWNHLCKVYHEKYTASLVVYVVVLYSQIATRRRKENEPICRRLVLEATLLPLSLTALRRRRRRWWRRLLKLQRDEPLLSRPSPPPDGSFLLHQLPSAFSPSSSSSPSSPSSPLSSSPSGPADP